MWQVSVLYMQLVWVQIRFLVQWQKINDTYGNVGYTEKDISFNFYVHFIVIYHRTYYTE